MPALAALPQVLAPTVVAQTKSSGGSGSLILIVAIAALGLVVVFNSRRKQKAVRGQQTEIDVGTTIVTRAGLIATLVERTEDYVVLQLEDGTRARYVPQAVARIWYEPDAIEDDASSIDGLDDDGDGRHPDGEPPSGGGPLAD